LLSRSDFSVTFTKYVQYPSSSTGPDIITTQAQPGRVANLSSPKKARPTTTSTTGHKKANTNTIA